MRIFSALPTPTHLIFHFVYNVNNILPNPKPIKENENIQAQSNSKIDAEVRLRVKNVITILVVRC